MTAENRNPDSTTGAPADAHEPVQHYEIRVKGHLPPRWSTWFEGMTIEPDVTEGTTVADSSAEARARHMSTEVSAACFKCHDLDFTVLDCPGSVDFIQETWAAVVGCDLAVVVVEPVLERMIAVAPLLQFLDANAIPHLVFINKMDRSDVRYRDLLQTLRQLSARPVVLLPQPDGPISAVTSSRVMSRSTPWSAWLSP